MCFSSTSTFKKKLCKFLDQVLKYIIFVIIIIIRDSHPRPSSKTCITTPVSFIGDITVEMINRSSKPIQLTKTETEL